MDLVRLVDRLDPPPKVIRIERCDFPASPDGWSYAMRTAWAETVS
ncbi:MAG TPA: hypothetical protein VKU01_34845 [Bryobacteraceae bacterium]|nr:hypothetical protein [Bryobacteraceae bacterium]